MVLVAEASHSCLCKGFPMGPEYGPLPSSKGSHAWVFFLASGLECRYNEPVRIPNEGPALGEHRIYFGFESFTPICSGGMCASYLRYSRKGLESQVAQSNRPPHCPGSLRIIDQLGPFSATQILLGGSVDLVSPDSIPYKPPEQAISIN